MLSYSFTSTTASAASRYIFFLSGFMFRLQIKRFLCAENTACRSVDRSPGCVDPPNELTCRRTRTGESENGSFVAVTNSFILFFFAGFMRLPCFLGWSTVRHYFLSCWACFRQSRPLTIIYRGSSTTHQSSIVYERRKLRRTAFGERSGKERHHPPWYKPVCRQHDFETFICF